MDPERERENERENEREKERTYTERMDTWSVLYIYGPGEKQDPWRNEWTGRGTPGVYCNGPGEK